MANICLLFHHTCNVGLPSNSEVTQYYVYKNRNRNQLTKQIINEIHTARSPS